MNISSLIKKYPHEDAEFLLAHVLTKPREFVIAHPEYKVNFFDTWRYKKCVQQRNQHIPLAYITEHKEFFGLDFLVDRSTLIPRPETELMVEEIIATIKNNFQKEFLFIDVGTGSGCIPITVLQNTSHKNSDIKIRAAASDISKQALAVAQKNSKIYHTDIQFFQGSLLEPFEKKNFFPTEKTLVLSANLPYLTQEQFDEEISIQKEPYTALVADEAGLSLYRKLLEQLKQLQQKNSLPTCILFFEIDPSQTSKLVSHITHNFPKATIEVKQDLRKQDRVVKILL